MAPEMPVAVVGLRSSASSMSSVGWHTLLEPALFMIYDENNILQGVCLTHVDDFLHAGFGPVYDKAILKISDEFKLKASYDEFTFCGKHIVQDETKSIFVDQKDAANGLEFITIDPQSSQGAVTPVLI